MSELISVIMSAYNEDLNYIRQAVDSILNQTYKELEIIFINDNPNRTEIDELIKNYNCSNIIYVKNKKNEGLATCMNIAAGMANGTYLARMDADDVAVSNRLEKELDYLLSKNMKIVSTGYSLIDEKGESVFNGRDSFSSEIINDLIPYYSPICHPTVMIEKKLFDDAGGYNNYPCSQDYDLWLRLYYFHSVRFGYIDEALYLYRIRNNSITAQKNYQQYYTSVFQRKMIRNKEPFSLEKYRNYMALKGVYDKKRTEKFKQLYALHRDMKGKSNYLIVTNELRMLSSSVLYRDVVFNEIRKKLVLRWMLRKRRR